MNEYYQLSDSADMLASGAVGVIPTDTLYGLVCIASNAASVERLYEIKGRPSEKALIVLIADIDDLARFDIDISPATRQFLEKVWPGKVSVILPCASREWEHVHRGNGTIAFRVPDKDDLRALIKRVGPIVAPSANLSGNTPATDPESVVREFGDRLDLFVNVGTVSSPPSTLVDMSGDAPNVLRRGAVDIDDM